MNLLTAIVSIFIVLELSNVLALYYKPTFDKANAVGMFKAWEKSKSDENIHDLMRYLVYWVAGSKLIFLSILMVVLIYGDSITKKYAVLALIASIGVFYYKMYPLIISIDKKNELEPKGYSKKLGGMIAVFIIALAFAAIWG